ncbi:hypothetical protein Leryth_018064 [Lithospermum erythrorhizon]|nr:hypothetical protein Leryth_018064 [Lithospermum erythrorhizon]
MEYLKHGVSKGDVVDLFLEMRGGDVRPNSVTYSCILSACGSEGMVLFGGQIHGEVIKNGLEVDPSVTNSLAAMYTKCHCLFDARQLFGSIRDAGLVTWNVMIGGYVQNGLMPEALELFQEMISMGVKPDNITFSSLLPAISEFENVKLGKEIHGYIMRQGVPVDLFLKNALIDMYLKCRNVELACQVFEDSRGVDVVICSSMISGLVLNGKNDAALETFRWMLLKQMRPNAVTLASLLPACAGLGILRLGKRCMETSLEGDGEKCYVGDAIIDMYLKCARCKKSQLWLLAYQGALCACANLPALHYGQVSWNNMIAAYGSHGQVKECLSLFNEMESNGFQPDHVLSCNNIYNYRFAARMEHYASMIDLLGRAGRLVEAFQLIESMPFTPDAGIWATAGKFDISNTTRNMMKDRSVQKIPGYSWIEVNNATHMFTAADITHPKSDQIYVMLEHLLLQFTEESALITHSSAAS